MSPDCCNFDRLSRVALPTLTEVTFRSHSPHCCSFTAVIRDSCVERGVSFSQVVRFIASIGYVGKIDDFTIKPVEQHSFLLTGFSGIPHPGPRSVARLFRLLRRHAVTTSMLRVSDHRRAKLLVPGLLHREGVSRQSAITMVV